MEFSKIVISINQQNWTIVEDTRGGLHAELRGQIKKFYIFKWRSERNFGG
jgi:hypothetical protein